jgi:hypothetical protein
MSVDWKSRLVTRGLGLVFVLKFGKFVALEIWDVLGPLVHRWGHS